MHDISTVLRDHNLKKTSLRVAVLEVFLETKEPITIADLERVLQEKNISANQTSVYRQIETLTEKNIVQSIILKNSTAHYELQTHHHHHFICDACETIECVEDNALETHIHLLEQKLIQQGMNISSHQFSFHGKCGECD